MAKKPTLKSKLLNSMSNGSYWSKDTIANPPATQYGQIPTIGRNRFDEISGTQPDLINVKGDSEKMMSQLNTSIDNRNAKLNPTSFIDTSKTPKKIGSSALEIALGGAQMIGGLLVDANTNKPDPVQNNASPLFNAMAMETKNAANSTASRLMDIATNRADKDFASNIAEARRSSGGNAVAALMTGVNAAEQGKEAMAKASMGASEIMMKANQEANQLGAQSIIAGLDVAKYNNQIEQMDYMRKKNAAGTLMGAGMDTILESIGYNKYLKEKKMTESNPSLLGEYQKQYPKNK